MYVYVCMLSVVMTYYTGKAVTLLALQARQSHGAKGAIAPPTLTLWAQPLVCVMMTKMRR